MIKILKFFFSKPLWMLLSSLQRFHQFHWVSIWLFDIQFFFTHKFHLFIFRKRTWIAAVVTMTSAQSKFVLTKTATIWQTTQFTRNHIASVMIFSSSAWKRQILRLHNLWEQFTSIWFKFRALLKEKMVEWSTEGQEMDFKETFLKKTLLCKYWRSWSL